MRAYGRLWRVPQARLLLLAMVPVRLGYAMAGLSLVLLVRDRTGSFALAGAGLGVFSLAAGILAPLRGHVVDRFGQTRPLLIYLPVFCASFVALVLPRSPAAVLALCAVSGAASPPLLAGSRALWRSVVDPGLLRTAYAADTVSLQAGQVAGPAAAGALIAVTSPEVAVVTVAALVAVGGFLFVLLPASRSWRGSTAGGALHALRSPGIRALMVIASASGVCLGALAVGLPALAVDASLPGGGGGLLALVALGSVVGGGWTGSRTRRGPVRGLAQGAVLAGLCLLVAAWVPWTPGRLGLLLTAGIGLGVVAVHLLELVDRVAPPGSAVSAFAGVVAVEGSLVGLGAWTAGRAADAGGPALGLLVAAIAQGCLLVAVVVLRARLRAPSSAQWAADSQVAPSPTDTSNGTARA